MEAILLTSTRTGQSYFCKLTSNSSGNRNSLRGGDVEKLWVNKKQARGHVTSNQPGGKERAAICSQPREMK